jgi:hypothetical protein
MMFIKKYLASRQSRQSLRWMFRRAGEWRIIFEVLDVRKIDSENHVIRNVFVVDVDDQATAEHTTGIESDLLL